MPVHRSPEAAYGPPPTQLLNRAGSAVSVAVARARGWHARCHGLGEDRSEWSGTYAYGSSQLANFRAMATSHAVASSPAQDPARALRVHRIAHRAGRLLRP